MASYTIIREEERKGEEYTWERSSFSSKEATSKKAKGPTSAGGEEACCSGGGERVKDELVEGSRKRLTLVKGGGGTKSLVFGLKEGRKGPSSLT